MSDSVRIVKWQGSAPPTEQEAEAKLHQEGYDSFVWNDVPGAHYPRHRHVHDECLWILKGQITFVIDEKSYPLQAGDRLYLPAKTPHQAQVPKDQAVTYLVGEKKN